MSRFQKYLLAGIAGIALATGGSAGAKADPISSSFLLGSNSLHDSSGEIYIPATGNSTGQVEQGDIFISVFKINTNDTNGFIYTGSSSIEGVFAVEVSSPPTSVGSVHNGPTSTVAGINVTFAPISIEAALSTAGLTTAASNVNNALTGAGLGSNVFAAVFNPSSPVPPSFLTTALVDTDFSDATSGSLLLALSMGATDTLGANGVPLNVSDVLTGTPGFGIGGIFGSATIDYQNDGILGTAFAPSVSIAGNLRVPSATTDNFAINDSYTFTLTAVPEPGSLALLGSSLFGFGVFLRRRKRV